MAAGRASAELFALGSLRYRTGELKGYMLQEGSSLQERYRAVRVRARHVVCRPYPLAAGATGLTLCVATARLCTR